MCTYVYHKSVRKSWRICIFMFLLLFQIENDYVILFISHTKVK